MERKAWFCSLLDSSQHTSTWLYLKLVIPRGKLRQVPLAQRNQCSIKFAGFVAHVSKAFLLAGHLLAGTFAQGCLWNVIAWLGLLQKSTTASELCNNRCPTVALLNSRQVGGYKLSRWLNADAINGNRSRREPEALNSLLAVNSKFGRKKLATFSDNKWSKGGEDS